MTIIESPHIRRLGWALTVSGALAIGIATLQPLPRQADRVALLPLTCLVCGDMGGTDVVLNLWLFAPFAAGLALLGVGTPRILVIAVLLSLSIETTQLEWLQGRDANLSDLLTNATGATIAGWLVYHRAAWLLPHRRMAQVLTVAGVSTWICLEATTAWSLQPSLPATVYWGQWAPDLGFLDRFRGTVLGAAVAGDTLRPHRLPESHLLRDRLLEGAGPVTVEGITGRAPVNLAPIVSVFDGHTVEIFLLGQRRDQAIFRLRTRVSDLKFHPPGIGIEHALPVNPGTPFILAGSYLRGRYWLRVDVGGRTVERTLAASPNWAWSFMLPMGNRAFGWEVYWLTALWVGMLLFPIGYWAGRSGSRGIAAAVWLLVGVTLVLVPRWFALPPVHWSEWAAAGIGLMLAHAAARRSAGPGSRDPEPSGE